MKPALLELRDRASVAERLAEYAQLVAVGQGRTPNAVALRASLEEILSPNDPAFRAADTELRRQQFLAAIRRPTHTKVLQ